MDASAAHAPAHDAVVPRWPVFLRFGHHEEVLIGDVFADQPADMLVVMASLLRETADHLEERASRL